MTRGWFSIVLACALGACIGTLVSLDMAARFEYGSYFWGVGALFGGGVAYVAIDFRHLCAGVAESYHRTIAWRPHYIYWRAFFAQWVGGVALSSSMIILCWLVWNTLAFFDTGVNIELSMSWAYFGIVYVWPAWSFTFCLLMTKRMVSRLRWLKTSAQYRHYLLWNIRDGWEKALNANPISIIYWTLYGLMQAVIHLPVGVTLAKEHTKKLIVTAATTLWQFIVGVFIYAHSERRTICFVDATFGAAIGYSFGSAIIGAVAGVVLGIVNYELVSVRWLKLAPAPSS